MKTETTSTARLDAAVRHGVRSGVLLLGLLLAACGGSGGGGAPTAVNSVTSVSKQAASSFTLTSDNYGIENATYLSATTSSFGMTLRAAVATSMTDPDFKTVTRIDIADPGALVAGTVYSLGAATPGLPLFGGNLYFFNGHQSTLLQTVGGTIAFDSFGASPGQAISGSFSAEVVDGGDTATPKASYTIAGTFSFTAGEFGAILPSPQPVPVNAVSLYSANCASCHALGNLNPTQGSASDLSLKGGELNGLYSAGTTGHQGVTLAGADISALKVLLNVN